MTILVDNDAMQFGRDTLGPILLGELAQTGQFELVAVSAEHLRRLTGRAVWTGEEKLPPNFFDELRDRFGVDAVLFIHLTQYRAYEPLAVGWRVKLLDADEPHIIWAVDEVFDARVPEVAAAARRYAQQNPETPPSLADPHSVLVSPTRFGQYTAKAVVGTLPQRQ